MFDLNLKNLSSYVISMLFVLTSCTNSTTDKKYDAPIVTGQSEVLIRSDYKIGEITALCDGALAKVKSDLDQVAQISQENRNFDNTLLALEASTTELSDKTTPLTFMGYVSTNPDLSAEGSDCEAKVGQAYVEIFTRRDLYQVIAKASPRNASETRLLQKTLEGFEQNGLKLSDESLAKVRDLKVKLSAKENEFSTNLNADKTVVLFDAEELQGLPVDYLADLKKDENGKFIIRTKESDYPVVMQNAVKADTRKKMMSGYLSRGGQVNAKLLSEAVVLRAQIAKLIGFKNWADYRTNGRMAENSDKALEFLNGLKHKLSQRNQDDFAKILKFKKESIPDAAQINQWDISYYSYQLQKRDYSLDNEKIREYFPADVVIAGMFQVYSKMLGVRYEEITDAKAWAPDVKLYAIHNASDDRLIGYFYTDFFPRNGKYGHAAAFPLISAHVLPDGRYSLPVSSIVANLTPPTNGKPSLLDHSEVETVFHEFGHIMHQTLTRAPYASLSGSNVAQDFVEAPSQMLENWVWNKEILNAISGHYLNHSQKLPNDLLEKMIAAQEFNQAYGYTKQLLYALFDMTLHTQDQVVDVNQTYIDLYKQVIGQEPLAGQQFPASFGHLMGGYDAGYYGYLWSEVYAQDMFTQFPVDNLTSQEVGARYRKSILEKGNMLNALDLLREFLGREPNAEAFFKKLHIG